MNKHPGIAHGILMVLSLLTACLQITNLPDRFGEVEATDTPTANCPPLPENFKEADLIGTWVAEYGGLYATDMLVLREDGTYKQIYDDPEAGFHYESDWHTWWVELREVGYLWLHLDGMRRCDGFYEDCKREGGGTGRRTIDECEFVDIPQRGEVILVVTGASEKEHPPRSIWLRQTRLAGSEWYYSFRLQEEEEQP